MSRSAPCFEVRLYGLPPSVTNAALLTFFAGGITVLGTRIHQPDLAVKPQPSSDQMHKAWAQIWTASEVEAERCLQFKEDLARKGITIMRISHAPSSQELLRPEPQANIPPFQTPGDFVSNTLPHSFAGPHTPSRDPVNLARNLYVLGVPIDMTQHQFKALFVSCGMVEHSTLLSQLDGAGRRRGFVLMSTHYEAARAMEAMNGSMIDGYRMDISWALVQREAKYFQTAGALPNRVVHPPTIPTRRAPLAGCTVLVENLNPVYFPSAGAVRELFSHFGPVLRVTVLPGQPLTALLAFEHKVCAEALVRANGMSLNGQTIFTRYLTGNGEEPEGSDIYDERSEAMTQGQNAMLGGADMRVFGNLGPAGYGAIGEYRPLSLQTRSPFASTPCDSFHSQPPITFPHSTTPLASKSSNESLNLYALLRLDNAFARADSTMQDGKASSKVNKLNPESEEFVPGDGTQDLNSSPSKGSSDTRVGSASGTSVGSIMDNMKGWEAARKLWD